MHVSSSIDLANEKRLLRALKLSLKKHDIERPISLKNQAYIQNLLLIKSERKKPLYDLIFIDIFSFKINICLKK